MPEQGKCLTEMLAASNQLPQAQIRLGELAMPTSGRGGWIVFVAESCKFIAFSKNSTASE